MCKRGNCQYCGKEIRITCIKGLDPFCSRCSLGVDKLVFKDQEGRVIEPSCPTERALRLGESIAKKQEEIFFGILTKA